MSDRYELEIEIDDAARDALNRAQLTTVVAKPVGNAAPNVAWLALRAAPATIVWDETEYGVYASETPIRRGVVLRVTAEVWTALEGMTYGFSGRAFQPPQVAAGVPRGHFNVRNETTAAGTFGLVQAVTVNGAPCRPALNAVVLPPGFTADFAAATRLYVWTEPLTVSGMVVGAPNDATMIAFDREHRTRRYRYDRSGAGFVPVNPHDGPQPPARRPVSEG
jgi:hypothetical protein